MNVPTFGTEDKQQMVFTTKGNRKPNHKVKVHVIQGIPYDHWVVMKKKTTLNDQKDNSNCNIIAIMLPLIMAIEKNTLILIFTKIRSIMFIMKTTNNINSSSIKNAKVNNNIK